jgi:hypothetical protein
MERFGSARLTQESSCIRAEIMRASSPLWAKWQAFAPSRALCPRVNGLDSLTSADWERAVAADSSAAHCAGSNIDGGQLWRDVQRCIQDAAFAQGSSGSTRDSRTWQPTRQVCIRNRITLRRRWDLPNESPEIAPVLAQPPLRPRLSRRLRRNSSYTRRS